jgi:ribosomal protein S18 acetylase RimI-like enzyme
MMSPLPPAAIMSDTHTIVIRQMLPEDTAAVASLATELGYPATASEIDRRYSFIKDRWDARLLVAQNDERTIVGWIHVQVTYLLESDPRAEIWGLVVSQAARGAGVGRRLIGSAEEWAGMLGMSTVVVRSNIVRAEARGFYEHLGYTVTKTQNAFRKTLS